MTSYVEKSLLEGEKILYKTHRHWIVYAWPIAWVIITLMVLKEYKYMGNIAIFPLIIAIITGVDATLDYMFSEIALTNMRILIKLGFIARTSMETGIQNIASIRIDQSIIGRMLDYGTVLINDVGSTQTPFKRIANPYGFHRAVQREIELRNTPE